VKKILVSYSLTAFLVLLLLLSGCRKNEPSTLPIVTTSELSSIEATYATCGGEILDDGGAAISARGVCWSLNENPTVKDSKTIDGNGIGTSSSNITGLTLVTTYHVRAYASNELGTSYGNDIIFTTKANVPTILTIEITSITTTTAVSGGNITSDGGASVVARGVCWSTSFNPTISDSKTNDGSGNGFLASSITGLTPNTIYHVRSYATNSAGTAYGEDIMFTSSQDGISTLDNDNMLLGNPSRATSDIVSANNYLMIKQQYCLSYNNSKLTPNWTSWHLYSNDVGSTPRQDDFRADVTLPSSWYRVKETDYQFSIYGFDRGHMCPSADRTLSVADNSATFLMTNMIPQSPNNNQQTWANLENYRRTLINAGNELYIISGPYGQGGTSAKGTFSTLSSGVVVPSKTWKIIVVIPNGNSDLSRITSTTRVISVIMPNDPTCSSHPWEYYKVSVDNIETLTGYDFLSNVSITIQNLIEAKIDTGK